MTLQGIIVGAMSGSLGMVLVALIAWVSMRRLRGAETGERKATTRKTDAEVWDLMNGGLVETVERLDREMKALRTDYRALRAHLVEVHELPPDTRVRDLPRPPVLATW